MCVALVANAADWFISDHLNTLTLRVTLEFASSVKKAFKVNSDPVYIDAPE